MSVFKALKEKVSTHATRKPIDTLHPGTKYEVYNFKQESSKFPDKKTNQCPTNLLAFIKVDQCRNFVIMPNVYNDISPKDLEEMNDAIAKKTPPSIVFYGKDGPKNDVHILEFGEEVDQSRLAHYMKQEKDQTTSQHSQVN